MRHLLALAAAAALAGCTVDVEGAACFTPGSTEGCPDGQACGTGGTCSATAAHCAPCTPAARACRDGDVKECTAQGDPTCGAWVLVTACTPGATTCGVPTAGGAPECRCERFVADPAGAAASTTCRFATAAEAIADAQRFGVHEAWLGGGVGQDYGAAPVTVPAGMTLAGDDTPLAPADRVLEIGGTGSAAVMLEDGAALAGVTVRRRTGGPTAGVSVAGASPPGRSSLTEVLVDAAGSGGAFATGVQVGGAGAVTLTRLAVRGTSATGLEVARAASGEAVTAIDLLVDGEADAAGPGVGVNLSTGDLTLRRPLVKRQGGAGVVAAGTSTSARLTLEVGALHDNHGTGLVAQAVGRLSVAGTLVCKNKGGADRNLNGTFRKIGGLFLAGLPPGDQAFSGLRVFDNEGDQVGVGPGAGVWSLAGPSGVGLACESGVNAFAGYAPGSYGLVAAGGVDASWDAWPNSMPVLGTDVLRIGSPSVTLGTEGGASNYCSLPAGLDCPAP